MSTFPYESNSSSPRYAPLEAWATQDFDTGVPMENHVNREFTQYPWEATPDQVPKGGVSAALGSSAGVFPWEHSVITVLQERVQEVAHDYVLRIEPKLPPDVRDDFVHGAGMFDFPMPADDDALDDLLG
jgi:hypothetical protein